jgi:energy-coupling factor transporter ATP-binding protein EcfA2
MLHNSVSHSNMSSTDVSHLHHRKHDLWVLSNDPWLGVKPTPQKLQQSHSWTILARSTWHGPDRDGKMVVELLPNNQVAHMPQLARQQTVAALQGPDLCTDLQIAEFIRNWTGDLGGLLPALLKEPLESAGLVKATSKSRDGDQPDHEPSSHSAIAAGDGREPIGSLCPTAAAVVAHFKLNPGQAEVVAHVSSWQPALQHSSAPGGRRVSKLKLQKSGGYAQAGAGNAAVGSAASTGQEDSSPSKYQARDPGVGANGKPGAAGNFKGAASPVCLIHGPFGSGKSTLLVALIHLLVGSGVIAKEQQVQQQVRQQREQQQRSVGREHMELPSQEDVLEDEEAEDMQRASCSSKRLGKEQTSMRASKKQKVPATSDEEFEGISHEPRRRRNAAVVLLDGSSDEDGEQLTEEQLSAGRAKAGAVQNSNKRGTTSSKSQSPVNSSCRSAAVDMDLDPFQGEDDPVAVAGVVARPTSAAAPAVPGAGQARLKGGTQTKARQQLASKSSKAQGPACRVLVAAHTNVAVDRVLLGLLESGFTDILRVGSLQRIAKPLLQYSLHSADDSKDAIAQLNAMLQDATGRDAELIRYGWQLT